MELRQPPNNTTTTTDDPYPKLDDIETNPTHSFFDDFDSTCSTPYVSAPSSPGRGSGSGPIPITSGFYYSAPASPMHFAALTTTVMDHNNNASTGLGMGIEFEFGSGSDSGGSSIRSADELFLNGKIRPMKLSTHLEKPQVLAPLLDLEVEEEEEVVVIRGRDLSRDKSVRGRRTRSLSPLRSSTFSKSAFQEEDNNKSTKPDKQKSGKSDSGGGGDHGLRSSSGSRRWVFLKDFLRSKSEGRSSIKYFWLPNKEKKNISAFSSSASASTSNSSTSVKPVNGGVRERKRRVPLPSAHELHYTANRAQAEEMKKRTFLPYKQGLLGCLGFSSKGYGAMSGFARALNPVSSR